MSSRPPNERLRSSASTERARDAMLQYSAAFPLVAFIAPASGLGGVAAGAAAIAKVLFYIFLLITAVTLLIGMLR